MWGFSSGRWRSCVDSTSCPLYFLNKKNTSAITIKILPSIFSLPRCFKQKQPREIPHFLSRIIKKKGVSLAVGSRHFFFACFDLLGSKVRCVCTISDNLDVKISSSAVWHCKHHSLKSLLHSLTHCPNPFLFYNLTGSPLEKNTQLF